MGALRMFIKHTKGEGQIKFYNDMFERLMDRLYNSINIHAIDVIEDPTDIGASVREDILEQGEDTLTFLGNYIDQIDVKIDKQKLKAFAKELYMEAGE